MRCILLESGAHVVGMWLAWAEAAGETDFAQVLLFRSRGVHRLAMITPGRSQLCALDPELSDEELLAAIDHAIDEDVGLAERGRKVKYFPVDSSDPAVIKRRLAGVPVIDRSDIAREFARMGGLAAFLRELGEG